MSRAGRQGGRPATSGESEEERRARRRAEIFGDVLPETTSDEKEPSEGDTETASDAWLKRQVPPHHG